MKSTTPTALTDTYAAFEGDQLVARGGLEAMLRGVKRHLDGRRNATDANVLIFEDRTGKQIDFDFRGTADEVVARATKAASPPVPARPGPGRPKLGVTAREVTLLPRHWDWLEQQPQGISATLRRLVDDARKRETETGEAQSRAARDAAGKFMWAIAGNRPGFEEASRALYAGDVPTLKKLMRPWPKDVRGQVVRLLGMGGVSVKSYRCIKRTHSTGNRSYLLEAPVRVTP